MVGVFPSAFRPGPLSEFKQRLHLQMKELASESGESRFLMPVGLFPVIDKDNGGDTAAEELIRRFKLLDFESKNIVDFYFLGWRESFRGIFGLNWTLLKITEWPSRPGNPEVWEKW